MTFDHSNKVHRATADCSMGRLNFVAMTGQDAPERQNMLASILAKIDEETLEVVRIAFVDTHGIVRARPIEARLFSQAARNGVPFTTALFAMDSANGIFQNVFARDGGFGRDTMGGGGDMLAIPDLTTFRVLPWAHKCGWVLSDLYLKSGERCPLDPRLVMQTACDRLARQGLIYVGGVEVECHILKITDERNNLADCTQPPAPLGVEALRHGYQYMSENSLDQLEPIITPLRQALIGVGLPLRILDAEWGPGQFEISLDPLENMAAPDAVVLLRGVVKQVCRRMGLLASFMTKPALPNVYSSGWHLHQSLFHTASGRNAFAETGVLLSSAGLHSSVACSNTHEPAPLSPILRSMATSVCTAIPWLPTASCGRTTTRVQCAGWSAAWVIWEPISRIDPVSRPPIRISIWVRKSSPGWMAWRTGSIRAIQCRTPMLRQRSRPCRIVLTRRQTHWLRQPCSGKR